jgi:imidazolonepropionase-like amidohydrolase
MKYAMAVVVAWAGIVLAAEPGTVAIRNARIVTVSGAPIEKGTVVLRGGLIEAIGASVDIPNGTWVIEGEGLTVYPGLIDALSRIGLPEAPARTGAPAAAPPVSRGPEDRPATTSWTSAADLIQPSDRRIETFRNAGFTTAVTFPSSGIFAGQGAVINLAGDKPGQMVVAAPVAQYVTLATSGSFGNFPGSLMGSIAYIRQVYADADHYRLAKAAYNKTARGAARPEYDRALEGVLDSPRVLLPAVRAVEIERMIRFGQQLRQPFVLYGAHEAYRSVPAIKQTNVAVLVSLKWPEKPRDGDPEAVESLRALELRDQAPATPGALAEAGIRFAFYSDGLATPREVTAAVKKALDQGLKPGAALRALTLSAAEIYGVADRLGSIEAGKIANLVVATGDLFEDKTQVKYVFVDGVKFEPVERPAAENKEEEK